MKVLILLCVVAAVSCVPLRDKRSYYYGDSYAPSYYSYSTHDPVYSTHSAAPIYEYPGRTEVHTTSATRYSVQVPVTYHYDIEQPVHRSTTIYNPPNTVYSPQVYSAPRVVAPLTSYSSYSVPRTVSSVYSNPTWSS